MSKYYDNKDSVKLSELIAWIKQELLVQERLNAESGPLFAVEEVTVEVNFVVEGKGQTGLDVKVLQLGTEIAEQRVQKAIVKMKPILPYEEILDTDKDLRRRVRTGQKRLLQGLIDDITPPPRK